MFEEFRQFQRYQAFVARNPAPHIPAMPYHDYEQPRQVLPEIDPGSVMAMSQVKIPMLEGLSTAQIKKFRSAYRNYSARCVVNAWKKSAVSLLTDVQLKGVASANDIDVEVLKESTEDIFFECLCAIHHAASTREWNDVIK